MTLERLGEFVGRIAGSLDMDRRLYGNEYERYIDSPGWARRARDLRYERRHTCERCGGPGWVVHHRTYVRLGMEHPDDLELLCDDCHRAEHGLAYG